MSAGLLHRSLIVALLGAAACYGPAPAENLPCSPSGGCPDGQSCGTDSLCHARSNACTQPGGCGGDAGAPGNPDLDGHGAVGVVHATIAGQSMKCAGTLVDSTAILTRAGCVAGASHLEWMAQGQTYDVTGKAVPHPSYTGAPADEYDLALIFLDQPMAMAPMVVGTAAPVAGPGYMAVTPVTDQLGDRSNFKIPVTIGAVDSRRYLFTSAMMTTPFSCPASGGPTLGPDDSVIGLHSRSPCESSGWVDVRIDVFHDWIMTEIAANKPATCAGFAGSQCPDSGGCGQTACDDSSGQVVITCQRDEMTHPCGGNQTCDGNLECQDNVPPPPPPDCTAGQWQHCGGDCGWQFCNADAGTWFPCAANSNFCSDPATQECVPSGGGFACTTVTCGTAGKDRQCLWDPPEPAVPSEVSGGSSYWTNSGCFPNKCKECTCTDDNNGDAVGVLTCATQCFD